MGFHLHRTSLTISRTAEKGKHTAISTTDKMRSLYLAFALLCALLASAHVVAFSIPSRGVGALFSRTSSHNTATKNHAFQLMMATEDKSSDDGVVELVDEDTEEEKAVDSSAPFLSQGEIVDEALNPDLSDPKQARVIIYIILSLIPVLFLIPLMLGSRDLIPLDALPPVEMGN